MVRFTASIDEELNKNKRLNIQKIKKIFNTLKESKPNAKITMRGLNNKDWTTLTKFNKSSNESELNLKEIEEYYDGKVKDVGKFTNGYFMLDIIFSY